MASYTGGSRATSRIQALEQSRRRQQDDVNRRRADIAAASDSAVSTAAATATDRRFAARSETVEDLLKSDTVGLVTHHDFKARREYLERCAAGEREKRDAQLRERESLGRRARLQKANRATLSFAAGGDSDDDDDDDNDDDDDDEGGARERRRVGAKGASAKQPSADGSDNGDAKTAAKEAGEAAKTEAKPEPAEAATGAKPEATLPASESEGKPEPGVDGGSSGKRAGSSSESAGDGAGDSDGADLALTAPATAGGVGAGRKRRRLGMNPDVDTKFLPDRERELAERSERARLKQEWLNEQERVKREVVRITYSYWDGAGHRRVMSCKKGTTVGRFLAMVQTQFRELRNTSADALMFIKEDLIIPHHYSFYDFLVTKARGKSGPLFNFDVVEDVRVVADASKEKEDAHAGKVVERRWYERNRHIFPASRWEVYDPTKTYSRYTIHGD